MSKPIFLGDTPIRTRTREVAGDLCEFRGTECYRIDAYDRMPPFFMSVVSDSDHWIFLSSNGALTAGRKSPDLALFPYYTDDKIHDSSDVTGSRSVLLVLRDDRLSLWEPFTDFGREVYAVERRLYKSVVGDQVFFEELNLDLGLAFDYSWASSDEFGVVRRSNLRRLEGQPPEIAQEKDRPLDSGARRSPEEPNADPRAAGTGRSHDIVAVRVLDGIQNILPAGVEFAMQAERSTLLDAYKKCELDAASGLGIFRLSSIPVDRAEPSEALRATTAWGAGLANPVRLLSTRQVSRFREGADVVEEVDVRGQRGAFLLAASVELAPGGEQSWSIAAEVEQGPAEVANLATFLRTRNATLERLEQDIAGGTQRLRRIVASADGLQHTQDRLSAARHFSNVLFNVLRGGVPMGGYEIASADFGAFLTVRNRVVAARHEAFLIGLPESLSLRDLETRAAEQDDPQLARLAREYLPIGFGRRHGDPSRPWNRFSIDTRGDDGTPRLYYEGNWRDIFQNWEALAYSFPAFVESMIATFVNASTPDGYNPYRITRDGVDWEVHDPDDPWSYIGYWGDHQVVYLLKLLEISQHHHPGRLEEMLSTRAFAYANVPYRIKPYAELLRRPHDTIEYDAEAAAASGALVDSVGTDGKLVWSENEGPYLVNLTEKLLVLLLAKLSNYIPEAGIWMNTQRPEWNDANNALVGYGVSMVTLCHLRRLLAFVHGLAQRTDQTSFEVSEEVAVWFAESRKALRELDLSTSETHSHTYSDADSATHSDTYSETARRAVLDRLGSAGSRYRETIYGSGFAGGTQSVEAAGIAAFCESALTHLDHTIRAARRDDGLYHAYNLIHVDDSDGIAVRPLQEMLEGQVAVLSSGRLSAEEAVGVLRALRESDLYRANQNSYLLYPDRDLPRFLDRNVLSAADIDASPLLRRFVADGNRRVVVRDDRGDFHFAGHLRNGQDLSEALDELEDRYGDEVSSSRDYILDLFEREFDHRSFTGRSGTFYGYEGLGCIYWHMVSKLLLAVKETYVTALDSGASEDDLVELKQRYYEIREGIGLAKNPEVYGAFPIDPYSHTPGHAGARQPGMTGQVKEDIIARWGELGVMVEAGRIRFRPDLLRQRELLTAPAVFEYVDVHGADRDIELDAQSLAFTYCQVPIVYRLSGEARITVRRRDGTAEYIDGQELDLENSARLFERSGEIDRLEVEINLAG